MEAFDAYADALFRQCLWKLSDRERARDLTQETFIRCWQRILAGQEIRNLRAFLFTTARNLIIDEYRRRRPKVSLDEAIRQGFEPQSEDDTERFNRLIEARDAVILLRQLPEQYREVVSLRYLEDLTPQEISLIIGESENVVSVRIHRGVQLLRKIMKI